MQRADTSLAQSTQAVAVSNTAKTESSAAIAAVASSALFVPVVNVAAIPAIPQDGERIEVSNSTGIEAFAKLSGLPPGFIGDSGLSVRLQYLASAGRWQWFSYQPTDAEKRYLGLAGGTLTGPVTFADAQTFPAATTAKAGAARLADGAAITAGTAGRAVDAAQLKAATQPASTGAAGLLSAADKTKLDNIAPGAEVNVQPDWNEANSGSDAFIKNKPGDATTSAKGLVQLNSSTNSPSVTTAATPAAVKAAYDFAADAVAVANGSMLKAGGTFVGPVDFGGSASLALPVGTTVQRPVAGTGKLRFNTDLGNIEIYNGTEWQPYNLAAGRNMLINGAMRIHQRGGTISMNPGEEKYVLDRWTVYTGGGGMSSTRTEHSKRYWLGVFPSGANTAWTVAQRIEQANCIHVAGEWVTFSVYAYGKKAAAPFDIKVHYCTQVNNFGTMVETTATYLTVKSVDEVHRYTHTVWMPHEADKGLKVTITAWPGDHEMGFSHAQLELGRIATPFEFVDYATDLNRCRRYFLFTEQKRFLYRAGGQQTYERALVIDNYAFPVAMYRNDGAHWLNAPSDGTMYIESRAQDGIVVAKGEPAVNTDFVYYGVTVDAELY
jgi:hypothetical protein